MMGIKYPKQMAIWGLYLEFLGSIRYLGRYIQLPNLVFEQHGRGHGG